MKKNIMLLSLISAALVFQVPSISAGEKSYTDKNTDKMKNNHMTKKDDRPLLSNYKDGEPIVLGGKISQVNEDTIILNTDNKMVEVEFDEWPWKNAEMDKLFKVGDRVTVTGDVDKDWFSKSEIDANDIYLNDKYVYYYLTDMSPAYRIQTSVTFNEKFDEASEGTYISVSGTVDEIIGREFLVSSKGQQVTVDTTSMNYNPLDNMGLQKISVGDKVYVSGEVDRTFYDTKELSADSIITFKKADQMNKSKELASQ